LKLICSFFLCVLLGSFFLEAFYPAHFFWWMGTSLGSALGLFFFSPSFSEKVKEELKEKDAILDLLSEGVISFDAKEEVRYVNTAAAAILGLSKKGIKKKKLQGGSPLVDKALSLLKTAKRMRIPLTDSISLEREKTLFFHLMAVPDKRGSFLLLQDVSSQQKVIEVGRDFVANASHELKTPITIIGGFTETLQDMPDLPREIVDEILEKIVKNCQRMNSLVRNLLTLADIENIPLLNGAPCDLPQILEECRRATLAVYPTASIDIVSETGGIAEVEAGILELALLNLLNNAAKYSPSAAKIVVNIIQDAKSVIISIADEGAGIPEADIEHIFDRFYTVNKAHSRKLGGAGLGLSLVKKIIDKHEGTLEVRSTLGKGTTFTLAIPRVRGG
jgi:two-component system, OmpR family, phosphate regulon sensor histidine kinase PhoR